MALFMNNCPQYVMAHCGIQKIGAIVCPCGPLNKEHGLEYQLGDLQARVIVSAATLLPVVDKVRATTALAHVVVVHCADLLPEVATLALPAELAQLQSALRVVPAGCEDFLQVARSGAQAAPVDIAMDDVALMTYTQVRHVSRLFVAAANLSVPFFSVVLRKGYGLGAMGMTAGSFHAPLFNVAWPTGEFGAMGLEGAVRLGYRKELEALAEGAERDALFAQLLAQQYAHGEAMHMASTLEIDAVIDPADTRAWLVRGLAGARATPARARFVDTW